MTDDRQIDGLPTADYRTEPRKQRRVIGQKSAVSSVDRGDLIDMIRMRMIDRDPVIKAKMAETEADQTDQELFSWIKGNRNEVLFAIRGSEGVEGEERGELQGWVQVYDLDPPQSAGLRNLGIVPASVKTSAIFEISYAKLPGAPEGQIASGVRQALLMLPHELEQRDRRRTASYKTEPFIVAFIDLKENPESALVVERAGFVKKGEMKYESGDDHNHAVYVLDWAKLYRILHEGVLPNTTAANR